MQKEFMKPRRAKTKCKDCQNKKVSVETTKIKCDQNPGVTLDPAAARRCWEFKRRDRGPARLCRKIKTESGAIKTVWIKAEMLVKRVWPTYRIHKEKSAEAEAAAAAPKAVK